MTRDQIVSAYNALEQVKSLEKIAAKMKNEARGRWWKIEIPSTEATMHDKDMRSSFLEWMDAEITKLKQKHEIED